MLVLNIALFVHLMGVVTLFIALGILQRSGARARGASTVEEAHTWLAFAGTTRTMFPSAMLMILLTGLYMSHKLYTFRTPWIVVAITVVVLLPLIGGLAVGRALGGVERALASGSGPLTPEQARLVRQPGPWITAGALNGMAIGLLWIMASKPGWMHSIVAVAVTGVLGGIIATMVVRSGR